MGDADIAPGHGRSPLGLAAQASQRALAEAGLSKDDIDGVFVASSYHAFPALSVCEYLGLTPRYMDSSNLGGCSFVAHLAHAAAAIDAGLCEVALVTYGSTQRSDDGRLVSLSEKLVYEEPYGLLHPAGSFGMIAHRHMAEFGTTSEQLAAVAVSARAGAGLADVDTAHVYGAFTISLLILLEDIGFCSKGEGCPFVADGNIAPGGSMVLNPNGGGLSYLHPGMLGLYLLLDAVEQLRGAAGERQVPGVSVSLVYGMGMTLAAHATAVLSTEP